MSTLSVGTIKSASSAAPVFQNSSGTEIIQGAKAWINFNGGGTIAIRASFNVSSITDDATGKYTINFANAMANTNYCPIQWNNAENDGIDITAFSNAWTGGFELATGTLKVASHNPSTYADSSMYHVVVFGD